MSHFGISSGWENNSLYRMWKEFALTLLFFCSKGMLRHWDDSQKYLSDNPHLVCEETANYLVIWCIDLEVEEVSMKPMELVQEFWMIMIGFVYQT